MLLTFIEATLPNKISIADVGFVARGNVFSRHICTKGRKYGLLYICDRGIYHATYPKRKFIFCAESKLSHEK